MDAGVSCNVCLMVSFSSKENIKKAEQRLKEIRPGLLKSLEKEHITLFPKVLKRLKKYDMIPNTVQRSGEILQLKKTNSKIIGKKFI